MTVLGDIVVVMCGLSCMNLAGANPYCSGLRLNGAGDEYHKLTSVKLAGFSIGRNDPDGCTGTVGPKTIYIAYSEHVVVENIEEYGAIGFGIHVAYSYIVYVRNCWVHDHKDGAEHLSGTDGIDVWYSTQINVYNNVVERVGDDGISFVGKVSNPDADIHCYNNTMNNISGAI
jgi:hypothetical protein